MARLHCQPPGRGGELLGQTVDPPEHCPYAKIACFAPCVICDKKKLEEQLLLDKFGHWSIAGEELSEGSGDYFEEGGGLSEGGGSEASKGERQRERGKGKAKVHNSWCTGWVAAGEARRRERDAQRS